MTVDLDAEIATTTKERDSKSRRAQCSVGVALRELPSHPEKPADPEQLTKYLAPDSEVRAQIVIETVARVWPEYKFSRTTLGVHRRRDCSCSRENK